MTKEGFTFQGDPGKPQWLQTGSSQAGPLTWHVGQGAIAVGQREGQLYGLGALIAYGQLNKENGHGHLQVEAVLQHLRLSHGSLGREIDGHKSLKLLTQAVSCGARALLSISPGDLQPVQILVDFYHLIMQPASKKAEEIGSAGSYRDS